MASPQLENGFLRIANEVWDRLMAANLNGTQLALVMAVIRKTWGYVGKHEGAAVSIAQFAAMTGYTERGIRAGIRSLTSQGVLIQVSAPTFSQPSVWRFNKDWEQWGEGKNTTTPENTTGEEEYCIQEGKNTTRGEGKNTTTLTTRKAAADAGFSERKDKSKDKSKNNPPISPHAGTDRFDEFWTAYPVKVAKLKCRDWWKSHKPDDTLVDRMLTAISRQKITRQWMEGYIPHPSTWLNQGRWEDEVSPVPTNGKRSPPRPQPLSDGDVDLKTVMAQYRKETGTT